LIAHSPSPIAYSLFPWSLAPIACIPIAHCP